MKADEYFELIAGSEPAQWLSTNPVYLREIEQVSGGGHPVPWVESKAPHSLFTFRENLSISMAMGRDHLDKFQEDWAKTYNGDYPSSGWIDFLYNGQLIYSSIYVAADGGRCCLPIIGPLTKEVTIMEHSIFRLIHTISGAGGYDFDSYFRASGGILVDRAWPPVREY